MEELRIHVHTLGELCFMAKNIFKEGQQLYVDYYQEMYNYYVYVTGVSEKIMYPVKIEIHAARCIPPYQFCEDVEEQQVRPFVRIVKGRLEELGFKV